MSCLKCQSQIKDGLCEPCAIVYRNRVVELEVELARYQLADGWCLKCDEHVQAGCKCKPRKVK